MITSQEQIVRVLHNMAYSQDILDWELFASCWVSEQYIEIDLSRHLEQYDQRHITTPDLIEMAKMALSGFDGTQHSLSNIVISFEDGSSDHDAVSATARATITAYHYLNTENKPSTDPSVRATMRGIWNVSMTRPDTQAPWKAAGIRVTRLVPVEGNESLWDEAKARSERGDGRKPLESQRMSS